jgi:hypothetical protein
MEFYADDLGLYKTSADFNFGSDQSNMTPPTYLILNLNEIPWNSSRAAEHILQK